MLIVWAWSRPRTSSIRRENGAKSLAQKLTWVTSLSPFLPLFSKGERVVYQQGWEGNWKVSAAPRAAPKFLKIEELWMKVRPKDPPELGVGACSTLDAFRTPSERVCKLPRWSELSFLHPPPARYRGNRLASRPVRSRVGAGERRAGVSLDALGVEARQ